MQFDSPLIKGRLIQRYKRFLADVTLDNGCDITAHCANTGAMTGCMPQNANVWLSVSDNPKRKYAQSWQLVEVETGVLACINTSLTNKVAHEALLQNKISELSDFDECRSEVPYGSEGSRVDFVLTFADKSVYVEVKHVTLSLQKGEAAFPDTVTKRGQKHLRELIQQVKSGHRAVLLFIIMRTDVNLVTPADSIDPEYGRLLREAVATGVEVIAYRAFIDTNSLTIDQSIPVRL